MSNHFSGISMAAYNNRILVIDDDPSILSVFSMILMQQGAKKEEQSSSIDALMDLLDDSTEVNTLSRRNFEVDTASQGEVGFALVQKALEENRPYSVIFTDMRMPPGWDGVMTAKKIREIDAEVEIIIVTAYSDAPVSEIVRQVGFTDRLLYLKKPFDEEEVLQLADSLSMRWNLEEKVKEMVNILEGMVDSFFKLKIAYYTSNEIEPFLRETLHHISRFLDTPDVFLVRFQEGRIVIKIGLGRFSNGLSETEEFKEMLKSLFTNKPIDRVLHINQYIVMPINMKKCQDVIVGLMGKNEIEGADRLLNVLARDMAKVFETITTLSDLRQELDEKEQRIALLEEQVRTLQKQ